MARFAPGERITWVGFWLNLGLGIAKCLIGLWANSRALVADGLHSFSDLATDLAVLAGFKYAIRPSDARHPYGHHRIATLVTVGIGGAILLFCVVLIAGGLLALRSETTTAPSAPALVCALVALALKEWLYYRTRSTAKKIQSRMLMMNAWHHRTDSISSVVAAIGIGIALAGGDAWGFVDTLAGVALGGYLAMEAVRMVWRALSDLLDAAPDQAILDDLREHILPTTGAVAYHEFRARRMGDCIEVDLHLLVDPQISVQEGHRIAWEVKHNIMKKHPEVLNVLVHVEPYLPEYVGEKGLWDSNLPPA
jgi:cation diffusion facilitator family transporter